MLRLRSDELDWKLVDGEVVVLDLRRSVYLSLNDTGAVVWQLLADGVDGPDELLAAILDEFEVTEPEAAADLDLLLADLRAQDLLVEA